jgi:Sarcosine oxidase A3 domain/2Fe-2S iron-sulfur cluster binding domain
VSVEPTVASEAIRAGAPALAASFRFHRPRGPLCARGHCGQCEVATADGPALACELLAGAGRPRGRDPLRPVGLLAERFPPWFYERRLLRPRRLRGAGLRVLRHLSAAPALGPLQGIGEARSLRVLEAGTVAVGDVPGEPGALRLDAAAGDVVLGVYPERRLGVLRADGLAEVRFERLVLGTGAYERLPPIAGNDLPGVVGLEAVERYAAAGALAPGTRIACLTPPERRERVEALARAHGLVVVHDAPAPPRALSGRRRVEAVLVPERIACDLFVTAVRQPALELAQGAGGTVRLTEGELPVLVAGTLPPWLEVVGAAAAASSGVADVAPADDAFACLCEDVRFGDLRGCVAQGFSSAELVKRRTGAMTGPCQGKLCAGAVLGALRALGADATPTTARPLARPATLAALAADA